MLASRRWRDWSPEKSNSKRPGTQLTKPTKKPIQPILAVLSVPTLGIFENETAADDTATVDLDAWRAPFVRWIDAHYAIHLGSGTGFKNLARHYREWEEQNGRSCTDEICRAMLEELCFEIRMVQGDELVQRLVPRTDLK